jgi:competence protein ComEC
MLWTKLVFPRLLIPLVLGILLFEFAKINLTVSQLKLAVVFLFSLLLLSLLLKKTCSTIFSLLLALLFITLGYGRYQILLESSSKGIELSSKEEVVLEIRDALRSNRKYDRYFAQATFRGPQDEIVRFKVLLNIVKQDSTLSYGQLVKGQLQFHALEKPPNPAQFDYSDYLARKGVFHQAYLYEWKSVGKRNSLLSWSSQLKEKLIKAFGSSALEEDRLSILKAILLGDKMDLDWRTKSAFARAGAMHILAVSGLHVGIIFLIFQRLFRWLGLKRNRLVNGLLLLLIIWTFALITGLSTSVQRSSLMFSLIIVSELFNRRNLTLNSVIISALIILLIDPR